jgi:hypothetical protein
MIISCIIFNFLFKEFPVSTKIVAVIDHFGKKSSSFQLPVNMIAVEVFKNMESFSIELALKKARWRVNWDIFCSEYPDVHLADVQRSFVDDKIIRDIMSLTREKKFIDLIRSMERDEPSVIPCVYIFLKLNTVKM